MGSHSLERAGGGQCQGVVRDGLALALALDLQQAPCLLEALDVHLLDIEVFGPLGKAVVGYPRLSQKDTPSAVPKCCGPVLRLASLLLPNPVEGLVLAVALVDGRAGLLVDLFLHLLVVHRLGPLEAHLSLAGPCSTFVLLLPLRMLLLPAVQAVAEGP
eukprot:1483952-Alexandrium_andersonii.AAC.1